MEPTAQRLQAAVKLARQRIETLEKAHYQPIAVIGIGCRLPGPARDAESFWEALLSGRDLLRTLPRERWDDDALYDPKPRTAGRLPTRHACTIDEPGRFDAAFFGIAAREAAAMDPQHRLLLETAWEALEHGGVAPGRLKGSATGVYVGIGQSHAQGAALYRAPLEDIAAHAGTGTLPCFAAGRISYHLGLRGPSLALDTACSSSLTALHLACRDLRLGACDLALAGGVHLLLDPAVSLFLAQTGALAPDGRSKTLDAAANGFGRGEGCAMVALKRLDDAVRDGDPVLAVIRGSAANHDGVSSGLTAPSEAAQEAVVHAALRDAGLTAQAVDVVELHGTGTELGDPIEVQALATPYDLAARAEALWLTSVKSQIGHLEAAAGIAGFIKMVLVLHHGRLPAQAHFQDPNPHIPWSDLNLRVARTETALTAPSQRPLTGAVSAFGMSGSNVHVILSAPPSPQARTCATAPALLQLSAKSETALRDQAKRLAQVLAGHQTPPLADVAYTLRHGRDQFPHRLALTATTAGQAADRLTAFARRDQAEGLFHTKPGRRRLVWLFTGQGAQYSGMARQYYEEQAVFREAFDRCDQLLQPHLGERLVDLVFDDTHQACLDQTQITQPALFSVAYALAQTCLAAGLTPDAVLGHSIGEYVAATVAGVLDLPSALTLVAERGRLMGALPAGGAMAALHAAPEQVATLLQEYGDTVAIAAINGPRATVISGAATQVDVILARCERQQIGGRRLQVSHAFHSPLMQPMLERFAATARGVRYQRPQITWLSTLTGTAFAEVQDPAAYWTRHISEPVLFHQGLQQLSSMGETLFLELGPKPILTQMGKRSGLPGTFIAAIDPNYNDRDQLMRTQAVLFVHGHACRVAEAPNARRTALPTYPFAATHFALPPRRRTQQGDDANPPFHGRRLDLPLSDETRFQRLIDHTGLPYADDHRVYGATILPAASHVAMVLSALGDSPVALTDISFSHALQLDDHGQRRLQLICEPASDGQRFRLISSDPATTETSWRQHAGGRITPNPAPPDAIDLAVIQQRCGETLDPHARIAQLAEIGFHLGPAFQWTQQVQRGDGELLARICLPQGLDPGDYRIHPGRLDSCFQLLSWFWPDQEQVRVPFHIGAFHCYHTPPADQAFWCHARVSAAGAGDLTLCDDQGQVLAAVYQFVFHTAARDALVGASTTETAPKHYRRQWHDLAPTTAAAERCLVVGAKTAFAQALGPETVQVTHGASFDQRNTHQITLNLEHSGETARLLHTQPIDHLIWWAPSINNDMEDPTDAVTHACQRLLTMVQALAEHAGEHPPRLTLITQNADEQPVAAALRAMVQTMAHEMPWLQPSTLDLPAQPPNETALAQLVRQPNDKVQRRIHNGRMQAADLTEAPLPTGSAAMDAKASYLITGGMGALGLVAAERLIAQGARCLILVGRHVIPLAQESAWRQAGVRLEKRACDVADQQAVLALFAEINTLLPPLRGVIHAAGTLQDGILLKQGPARFASTFAAKLRGTWLLDRLTRKNRLDFFLCYSSEAAVTGAAGQGNYAAANAAMAALTAQRNRAGLPGLSVHWGAWSQAGMAVRGGGRRRTWISPDQGGRLLSALLAQPQGDAVLLPNTPATDGFTLRHAVADNHLQRRIQQSAPETRETLLREQVTHTLVALLGGTAPAPSTGFFDLGLDSITAL